MYTNSNFTVGMLHYKEWKFKIGYHQIYYNLETEIYPEKTIN